MTPVAIQATGDHRLMAKVVTGLLVAAGVTCLVVGGAATLNRSAPPAPPLSSSEPTVTLPTLDDGIVGPVMARSIPTQLAIPRIGVSSSLLQLGLSSTGVLDVPPPGPTYDQVGWYRYSPTPGEAGPAVLVGHVDSATDSRSVFYALGSLRHGDTVRVLRADGSTAVFAVDDVRRYDKSRFPTQLVYGNIDHAGLRLITCGGPIDPRTGHYRDNVVVSASLVGSTGSPAPMLEP